MFRKKLDLDWKNRWGAPIGKTRRILKYEPEAGFGTGLTKVREWFESN